MTCNIAAIAYISRRLADDRKFAVLSSLFYALGRITSHALLGIIIIGIGLEVTGIRNFLESVGTYVIGPFLIAVGLLMLFADRLSFGGGGRMAALSDKVSNWGLPGAFLMGFFFALAFCPYSALLFFAVMIPLALTAKGGIFLPPVFALGSGLPVVIVGVFLSAGVTAASIWAKNLTKFQKYIQVFMALALIGIGIYYLIESII
jgi:cytochrome c biogenesis protein CcdA